MMPLHLKIRQSSQIGETEEGPGILEGKHDELVSLVFRDVGIIILEIYQVYFPHEVLGSQT